MAKNYVPDSIWREGSCASNEVTLNVIADADPLAVCRITQLLLLLNRLPRSLFCVLSNDETLHVSAVLDGPTSQTVDIVRRKLMQLTCVTSVAVVVSGTQEK